MKLESEGLLIALRPFNERDAIAHVFTRDFGILVGMMRGAVVAKKNKPLVGQVGNVSWNARLDSQLGILHWEAEKNVAVQLMYNRKLLGAMNCAFDLLGCLLPERQEAQALYNETILMIEQMAQNNVGAYLKWEISLLRELGYALDLSKCSGCGGRANLTHLSPRTGRAVCEKCARPYLDKLYPLPVRPDVTIKFLEQVCVQQGVAMPQMRYLLDVV